MAIVVNVPRDVRFGELGEGIGKLGGAIISSRQDKKDRDIIAGVQAGTTTESEGLASVSAKNRSEVARAGSSFRAANPLQSFVSIDEAGAASGFEQARETPEGKISLEVAKFNKARTATDKSSAINEIKVGFSEQGLFPDATPATVNRTARNVANAPKLLGKEMKNFEDQFGKITGDNQVRIELLRPLFNDYLLGRGGKEHILNVNDAMSKARKDTEALLKDFNKAKANNPALSLDDFKAGVNLEPAVAPVAEEEPSFFDKAFTGAQEFLKESFGDPAAQAEQPDAPVPDVEEVIPQTPEARVQDATDAAVAVDYPVQDGEQWVEVSDGLPLVPRSMMDVVKVGDIGAVAPVYAAMANIPLHLAIQILQANAGKAPIPTLTETKVIPDPISDGVQ